MQVILQKKSIVTGIMAALVGFTLLFGGAQVSAQTAKDAVCNGIGGVTGGNGCATPATEPKVDSTVKSIIDILSLITAVIAVIMVIIGGIKFITSSGDSGSTASARNTIIYAIIGLVIVALAQLIVRFVIERVAPATPIP